MLKQILLENGDIALRDKGNRPVAVVWSLENSGNRARIFAESEDLLRAALLALRGDEGAENKRRLCSRLAVLLGR